MLFILAPPEFFNFSLEADQESFITGKVNSLDFAHKMAMVMVVTVVVAENAAVVGGANSRVDVGQTIFHNLACFVPDLLFENGSASSA
jgi:hypothetical protein